MVPDIGKIDAWRAFNIAQWPTGGKSIPEASAIQTQAGDDSTAVHGRAPNNCGLREVRNYLAHTSQTIRRISPGTGELNFEASQPDNTCTGM